MTVQYLPPAKRQYKRVTEEQVQGVLAGYFDYAQNYCFRSVFAFEWEADFVVVSKAMRLWEIEIKVSMGDWRADAEKQKWTSDNWRYISRFYYAVPAKLLKNGIPPWVPEWAGVLALQTGTKPGHTNKLYVRNERQAKNLGGERISDSQLFKLLRSTYFRFWRNQKHDPDMVGTVDCRDHDLVALLQNPSPF